MSDKAKILIVDDKPLIRDAFAFKLTKDGYDVDTAEDGEKAIQKIESEEYQIIISDIMMPFISGFELVKILKERGTDAPVLMLNSLNSETAVLKAARSLKRMGRHDVLRSYEAKELSEKSENIVKHVLDDRI